MKKGCLIAVALFFAIVVSFVAFIYSQKSVIMEKVQSAFEVPPHGERAYINERHGPLLRQLDAAADQASSAGAFRTAVTALSLPPEVLAVGLIEEEDDDLETIVKTFDWSGVSRVVINGYGAGTLSKGGDEKAVMIYENDGPWGYMESFTVYLEHTESPAE